MKCQGFTLAIEKNQKWLVLRFETDSKANCEEHHPLGTVGQMEEFLVRYSPRELEDIILHVDTFMNERNPRDLESWKILACSNIKHVANEVLAKVKQIVKFPKEDK